MGNRIVILVVGLLMVLGLQAQVPVQYIGTTSNRVVVRNQFKVDSLFTLPIYTHLTPLTGSLRYQIADSSLYVWTGFQWRQIGAGGGGSSYSFTNGLTESGGTVKQGGSFTENTSILGANYTYGITGLQSGELSAETAGGITSRLRLTPLGDAAQLTTVNFLTGTSTFSASSTSGLSMSTTSYVSGKTSTISAFPDSIRLETVDGRFSLPFMERANVDTTNLKPFVWDVATKRMKVLYGWPSSGGGNLINGGANVGSGVEYFKDTSGNKLNFRTGTAGWGLDVTQNTNDVEYKVDSTEVPTVTALRDTASTLRNLISADGTTYGTYAQRVALTGSVQPGHRFYQTNERIGLWVKGVGTGEYSWSFLPENIRHPWLGNTAVGTWLTTAASGSGSGANYNQAYVDSSYQSQITLNTGTTSTGDAYMQTTGFNNFLYPPLDTAYATVFHIRLKFDSIPTSTNDYRAAWGFRGGSAIADSTAYGSVFRMAFYRENTYLQVFSRDGAGTETITTTTNIEMAFLRGKANDYVQVAHALGCDFYVNGVLVAMHRFTPPRQYSPLGMSAMIDKVSGTVERRLYVSQFMAYGIKRY